MWLFIDSEIWILLNRSIVLVSQTATPFNLILVSLVSFLPLKTDHPGIVLITSDFDGPFVSFTIETTGKWIAMTKRTIPVRCISQIASNNYDLSMVQF